ncbi:hypothetical protein DPMN_012577 [Dreissena polymorpha]|uniref:Uncharacterized protein n=1 Tax=Dreissena polymorpha TaxID=45954 RepID=A0A9D4S1I7_DREPO|nr:hypothetical protein DPMN_012577 [Dreissena polymorpha]
MELTILSFIRSLREANFNLYTKALAALIPYFFANYNMNNARWLPIHLRDMIRLDVQHPELSREFHAGKFVVLQIETAFHSNGNRPGMSKPTQ